jgi:hypothetical protein
MTWLEGYQMRTDVGEGVQMTRRQGRHTWPKRCLASFGPSKFLVSFFSCIFSYTIYLLQVDTTTKTNYGMTGRVHGGGREVATARDGRSRDSKGRKW